VTRRTLTRTGFVIDHVQYYSDALKPWIARREELDRFVLRRDPRDISRIWVLDPDGGAYLEVPYRTLSRPPISAWEQKAAVARLRELGRAEVGWLDAVNRIGYRKRLVRIEGTTSGPVDHEPGPLPPLIRHHLANYHTVYLTMLLAISCPLLTVVITTISDTRERRSRRQATPDQMTTATGTDELPRLSACNNRLHARHKGWHVRFR
jgi:hypothetical protein